MALSCYLHGTPVGATASAGTVLLTDMRYGTSLDLFGCLPNPTHRCSLEKERNNSKNLLEVRPCCTFEQMLISAAMSRGPVAFRSYPSQGISWDYAVLWTKQCVQRAAALPGGKCSQIDIQLPMAKNTSKAKLLKIIKETRDWKLDTNTLNVGQNLTFKTPFQQIPKPYYLYSLKQIIA